MPSSRILSRARRPHVRQVALLLALAALGGCGDAPHAGETVDLAAWGVPADLAIQVEQGSTRMPSIDRARLQGLAPDYGDGEHVAWRVGQFFGEGFERSDAILEVLGAEGVRLSIPSPAAPAPGAVVVLTINRKGEALVEQVQEAEPFPPYHGRGGSRGRTQQGLERVRQVQALRLSHGGAGGGGGEGKEVIRIRATVDGQERVLTEDDLVAVESLSVPGDSGEGRRDAWSLRVLVSTLFGTNAQLVAVAGEGGRTHEVSPAAWADVQRIPVLRLNRRGQLKFHWVDASFAPLPGDEVRQVDGLVIRTR